VSAPTSVRAISAVLACAVTLAGCATARLTLPSGSGEPVADPAPVFTEALGHCDQLQSLTAEVGLSGRAGGERIRGRLIAGFAAPASVRLEAVAPFGPPVFILAASPRESTLLLPRDERVLTGEAPADILEALAGLSLEPDELRRVLGGCPRAGALTGARRIGSDWIVADEPGGGTVYLRQRSNAWRLAAVTRPSLVAEFSEWTARQPGRVRLHPPDGHAGPPFDLTLRLSQVETNVAVPDEAFTVRVPDDAVPITLDELRQAGPMRDRAAPESSS
jgi:predicted small secreted protein